MCYDYNMTPTKEQEKVWHHTYYLKNKKKILARTDAYRKSHPSMRRNGDLKRRYGLSRSDFDVLLKSQGGVCAICRKPGWAGMSPHVDHDHETGAVRGILCKACNSAMGLIKEDLDIAQSMVEYMKKFKQGGA